MEKCPFGGLPPEIRNRIYELVLQHPIAIKIGSTVWRASSLAYDDEATFLRPTNLLQTCKQIRSECRQLFFATNIFEMEAWNEHMILDVLRHFLRTLGGENSAMLRRVNVVYLGKPIDVRNGEDPYGRHTGLLRKLKELCHVTKHLKNCSIQVIFKSDFYTRQVFDLQGLSPYLIFDLRDFGKPWDEQIDAFRNQAEIWKVIGTASFSWAIEVCAKMEWLLDHWRKELQNI